jgi:transposase InsO family protein
MPDPYTIAAWRFEQIAPLIDPSLDETQRRAALRSRTRSAIEWPGAEERKRRGKPPIKRPIPKSTLYRWLEAFRTEGYLGLLPKPRADRGRPRRAGTEAVVGYALGLLYEQPQRSLTQLGVYLQAEFPEYPLSRSGLARALRAHPAFAGIERLRKGTKSKLRSLYEASHPHESWQLDAKGPFLVRLKNAGRVAVHVLSILDDHSRYALAARVAPSPSTEAAIRVFEQAGAKWGLPDRFQFDLGSAFESKAFRQGLATLGIHRNAIKARSPEWQGKIEAYHRSLGHWFVNELSAQEVVDLEHLGELLEAMLALLYNRHLHRELGTTPEKRLAGRLSERQVSLQDLERAFLVETTAKSDPKTGEVRLPSGRFRVPAPFAGARCRFRYHPVHTHRAILLTRDARELELTPFVKRPLSAVKPQAPARGTGQLQKLLDRWRGEERPNAQPGFGLPELFRELGSLLGRLVPASEHEARTVLAFYRRHGPLPREPFLAARARAKKALGPGRPLAAYLHDLERQIIAENTQPSDPKPERDQP